MIQNQVYVFLCSLLVGVLLALIFDFFRIFRRKGKTKNYIVYIQDIIYWMIVTVIIIISAFLTNSGELRGYMFIGYIIGAIIHIVTISKYILKFANVTLDFLENMLKKILAVFKFIGKKDKNVNL